MKKELYFKEIKEIEDKFYDISSNFNTNFPKIINLNEEKIKFLSKISQNKVYNPVFIFEEKSFPLDKFKELKSLKVNLKNDFYNIKRLYKERIKSKIYEIETHRNWGKVKSSEFVKKYRGEPSYFLLLKAKFFCKNYKREKIKFRKIEAKKVGKILLNQVKFLTGDKVKIVYDKNLNSKINIIPSSNIIKINPNEKFRTIDVKRLSVHEIGVHYMRYFNGKNLGFKIFEIGTSNYIETEEGLAVYSEKLAGVSSNAQMYIYAGRVIATYYSLRKSFYEVFMILKSYGFSDEIAFTITARSKRNLADTSKKGGFTKDYVYFKGYESINNFVKKGGNLNDLFIGKIKLEDLKLLKKFMIENKVKIKTIFD